MAEIVNLADRRLLRIAQQAAWRTEAELGPLVLSPRAEQLLREHPDWSPLHAMSEAAFELELAELNAEIEQRRRRRLEELEKPSPHDGDDVA